MPASENSGPSGVHDIAGEPEPESASRDFRNHYSVESWSCGFRITQCLGEQLGVAKLFAAPSPQQPDAQPV